VNPARTLCESSKNFEMGWEEREGWGGGRRVVVGWRFCLFAFLFFSLLCVCVCVCLSLSLSLLFCCYWKTQILCSACVVEMNIVRNTETGRMWRTVCRLLLLFREFVALQIWALVFRLLFFTIHCSDNFALVNSDCTSSQFILQTIFCSWESRLLFFTIPSFRVLCSCGFRLLFFTILSSDNFAQLQNCIALHCSWEFCSSETDIKSSMFKSFHRYLLALPTKARILCLDSL
jgi:hypothetical protein